MPYVVTTSEIHSTIAECAQFKTLWIDTEVADYKSRNPRLSLIQVLADPKDMTGDSTYLLDVLEQPDTIKTFIDKIMVNPDIEKVFHNARYDVKFLGNNKAENITCTLEMAKKVPYYLLPVPDYSLKTLATELCKFNNIDKQEQSSDWGMRPLTEEQIDYAYLDCIYLAQVHLRLLKLIEKSHPNPATEDVTLLGERYTQIEYEWKLLNSEIDNLKERVKKAMQVQNLSETSYFKLSAYERSTVKVPFSELARLAQTKGIELDFPITLTQKIQKSLGKNLEELSVEIETNTNTRLTPKGEEGDTEDE